MEFLLKGYLISYALGLAIFFVWRLRDKDTISLFSIPEHSEDLGNWLLMLIIGVPLVGFFALCLVIIAFSILSGNVYIGRI